MARTPRRNLPIAIASRRIAITGGARGIGQAIAELLVARGAKVAIGDIDEQAARDTAERLGAGAVGLKLDVTDESSFRVFLDGATAAIGGPLDVLVNNAGIMWVGPFEDEPSPAARRQFDINFHGLVTGMRLVLPDMRARGTGHVVNIASAASRLPPAGEATYAATKHAVLGYCGAVRQELRGSGVELSLVMPVVVETELAAGTSPGRGKRLMPHDVSRAVVQALERPRFEVFVPRSIGAWVRLLAILPQPGRDLLLQVMMPNQVRDTDMASRQEYEQRQVLDSS